MKLSYANIMMKKKNANACAIKFVCLRKLFWISQRQSSDFFLTMTTFAIIVIFIFTFLLYLGVGQFAYCGKLRGASWRGDGLLQEASELLRIIAKIAATCQFPKANAASELCQMIGKNSILPKSWSVNQRSTAVRTKLINSGENTFNWRLIIREGFQK